MLRCNRRDQLSETTTQQQSGSRCERGKERDNKLELGFTVVSVKRKESGRKKERNNTCEERERRYIVGLENSVYYIFSSSHIEYWTKKMKLKKQNR
jgi:hypothetical protein